jgi:hypothetical protein
LLAEQLLGTMRPIVAAIAERVPFVRTPYRVEHGGMHAGGVV